MVVFEGRRLANPHQLASISDKAHVVAVRVVIDVSADNALLPS